MDRKFVVHSNDDTLTPEDLALGYKQLTQVEWAWRLLKSGLRIRPMFHWAPHRICAHVSLTMVALLLERLAERGYGDTWRNIRDDLRQIKLAQFLTPHGELWQVTDPLPPAANRLKQQGIPAPPPVLKSILHLRTRLRGRDLSGVPPLGRGVKSKSSNQALTQLLRSPTDPSGTCGLQSPVSDAAVPTGAQAALLEVCPFYSDKILVGLRAHI